LRTATKGPFSTSEQQLVSFSRKHHRRQASLENPSELGDRLLRDPGVTLGDDADAAAKKLLCHGRDGNNGVRAVTPERDLVTPASVFHLFVAAMGDWLGKNRAPGWRAASASSEGLERGCVRGGVAVWSQLVKSEPELQTTDKVLVAFGEAGRGVPNPACALASQGASRATLVGVGVTRTHVRVGAAGGAPGRAVSRLPAKAGEAAGLTQEKGSADR
jgi:hypothetical protein